LNTVLNSIGNAMTFILGICCIISLLIRFILNIYA
jgi:hypothetical protein